MKTAIEAAEGRAASKPSPLFSDSRFGDRPEDVTDYDEALETGKPLWQIQAERRTLKLPPEERPKEINTALSELDLAKAKLTEAEEKAQVVLRLQSQWDSLLVARARVIEKIETANNAFGRRVASDEQLAQSLADLSNQGGFYNGRLNTYLDDALISQQARIFHPKVIKILEAELAKAEEKIRAFAKKHSLEHLLASICELQKTLAPALAGGEPDEG